MGDRRGGRTGCAGRDGWDISSWILTAVGCAVGIGALIISILIYRWTTTTDDERHHGLKDALDALADVVRNQAQAANVVPVDLHSLSDAERAQVLESLEPNEVIVRLERARSGKGNHPWLAVTTHGRVLSVYSGGRRGGVHMHVVDDAT